MTGRRRLRLALLAGVVAVATTGAAGYVIRSRGAAGGVPAEPVVGSGDVADPAEVAAGPHIVFRGTAPGAGYGRVALASLVAPDGARAVTPASCERVHATRGVAICLAPEGGFTLTYSARILGPTWTTSRTLPLVGVPSRARVSRDGSLVATTSFVRGDSYASAGQFSTRTVVTAVRGDDVADLERFTLEVAGRTVTAVDRNLWGVTFLDTDRFYATAASGGKTWLVAGSLSARRMVALREDAECPSVSPDGARVVYKKRGELPAGQWRLTAYEVATGRETPLAEVRGVDDQVDWLDAATVVYGLPRAGASPATSDVWAVPADGTGAPRVLVHDAFSPAVVR